MKRLIAKLTVMGMFLTSAALADDGSVEIDIDAENELGDELDLEVSGADFGSRTGSGELQLAGWSAIPLNIDSSEISVGGGAKMRIRIRLTDTSGEFVIVIGLSGVPKAVVQDIAGGGEVKLAEFFLDTDKLEVEIEIE